MIFVAIGGEIVRNRIQCRTCLVPEFVEVFSQGPTDVNEDGSAHIGAADFLEECCGCQMRQLTSEQVQIPVEQGIQILKRTHITGVGDGVCASFDSE